jgi:hypothetical protein
MQLPPLHHLLLPPTINHINVHTTEISYAREKQAAMSFIALYSLARYAALRPVALLGFISHPPRRLTSASLVGIDPTAPITFLFGRSVPAFNQHAAKQHGLDIVYDDLGTPPVLPPIILSVPTARFRVCGRDEAVTSVGDSGTLPYAH